MYVSSSNIDQMKRFEVSRSHSDLVVVVSTGCCPRIARLSSRFLPFDCPNPSTLDFTCCVHSTTMVDKRSLRSSKKDSQDPPAEEEKPKPTRTRSARSKKQPNKAQETRTSGTEEESITVLPAPTASPSQSEDVVMENQSEHRP